MPLNLSTGRLYERNFAVRLLEMQVMRLPVPCTFTVTRCDNACEKRTSDGRPPMRRARDFSPRSLPSGACLGSAGRPADPTDDVRMQRRPPGRPRGAADVPHRKLRRPRSNGAPQRTRRSAAATVIELGAEASDVATAGGGVAAPFRSDGRYSGAASETTAARLGAGGRPGAAAALGDPRTSR